MSLSWPLEIIFAMYVYNHTIPIGGQLPRHNSHVQLLVYCLLGKTDWPINDVIYTVAEFDP